MQKVLSKIDIFSTKIANIGSASPKSYYCLNKIYSEVEHLNRVNNSGNKSVSLHCSLSTEKINLQTISIKEKVDKINRTVNCWV